MRYLIILLCLWLCGCASVNARIGQVEQGGIEKTYNHPYNKVFYACEDTFPRMDWMIQESNFKEGYVYATMNAAPTATAGIKIIKVDDNKTLVKVLRFHALIKQGFYDDFFRNLEALLNRK